MNRTARIVLTEHAEGFSANANFETVDQAVTEMNRRLSLPAGTYSVYYEVWEGSGYVQTVYRTATRAAQA